jgi:hypothetical protein
MTTLFYKIPPHLPLPKGGKLPLFGRRPIGPLARRAKRGQGRFCGACQFNFETLNNIETINIVLRIHSGSKYGEEKKDAILFTVFLTDTDTGTVTNCP